MKVTMKGNSKERLTITTDERTKETEATIREIKKTSRKLRRLFKDGFEINLMITV